VLTKLRREEETEEERKARVKENIERKNRNKERREKRRMIEEAKKEEVVERARLKWKDKIRKSWKRSRKMKKRISTYHSLNTQLSVMRILLH
jgi:hypothetical protein